MSIKLTCCCGASICVDDCTAQDATMALNVFKENHAPCLKAWQGDWVKVTVPIDHPFVTPRLRKCPTCGGFTPVEFVKGMQYVPCTCVKPDPYQRFRDAIMKDGKRVFVFCDDLDPKMQLVDGVAKLTISDTYSSVFASSLKSPDQFFIEGVDIPPQPSRDWLDKHGVELTGECRRPMHKDLWHGMHGQLWGDGSGDIASIGDFSGRRWIVRKKKVIICPKCYGITHNGGTCAKCLAFEAWIDTMSSHTLAEALNSDAVARSTVRALWDAARA